MVLTPANCQWEGSYVNENNSVHVANNKRLLEQGSYVRRHQEVKQERLIYILKLLGRGGGD